MATLKPFTALRPQPELAKRICELPYDVYTSAEAAVVAQDNPYSFLHVSKPEIDLEPDIATVFLIPPRHLVETSSSFVKGLVGPEGWREVVRGFVPSQVYDAILANHAGP